MKSEEQILEYELIDISIDCGYEQGEETIAGQNTIWNYCIRRWREHNKKQSIPQKMRCFMPAPERRTTMATPLKRVIPRGRGLAH